MAADLSPRDMFTIQTLWKCNVCHSSYSCEEAMREHFQRKHKGVECPSCGILVFDSAPSILGLKPLDTDNYCSDRCIARSPEGEAAREWLLSHGLTPEVMSEYFLKRERMSRFFTIAEEQLWKERGFDRNHAGAWDDEDTD